MKMINANDKDKSRLRAATKASILVDALPYIRDFAGKVVVICYCCSNLLTEEEEMEVMKDISLLKSIGMKPIVVHDFRIGGDRYRENKRIANEIEKNGIKSVGLCGIDVQTLHMTIDNGYIPVVMPNDVDTENIILYPENTACEIAIRMGAEKLVYMSEEAGLFENGDERGAFIPVIMRDEAEAYLNKNKVTDSLKIKVLNAIAAVDNKVSRAHIIDGQIHHSMLLEFFSTKGIGTAVIKDRGHLYEHEKAATGDDI